MKKTTKTRILALILSALMIMTVAMMYSCDDTTGDKEETKDSTGSTSGNTTEAPKGGDTTEPTSDEETPGGEENPADPNTLGSGAVSFTLIIDSTVLDGGVETSWTIKTDETTLGDALKHADVKMIPADSSLEGVVETVNGITADWANNQEYWAFMIGNESVGYGIFEQDVEEGATYILKLCLWMD